MTHKDVKTLQTASDVEPTSERSSRHPLSLGDGSGGTELWEHPELSPGVALRSLPVGHEQAVLRLDHRGLTGINPTNWNSVLANETGKALRGRMSSG